MIFFVYVNVATNEHAPYPGRRYEADTAAQAAEHFANDYNVAPGNTIVTVKLSEESIRFFSTGGVVEVEAPPYV